MDHPTPKAQQTHIPFHPTQRFFLVGNSNRMSYNTLAQWPNWSSRMVVLYGPSGSGKTTLGLWWQEKSNALSLETASLAGSSVYQAPLTQNSSHHFHGRSGASGTSGTSGASGAWLWCDNVDQEIIDTESAVNLLTHVNTAMEGGGGVVLAGRKHPSQWPCHRLRDLGSRLDACLSLPLSLIDPDDLPDALHWVAKQHHMLLSDDVMRCILPHLGRSWWSVVAAVDALDQAARIIGKTNTHTARMAIKTLQQPPPTSHFS